MAGDKDDYKDLSGEFLENEDEELEGDGVEDTDDGGAIVSFDDEEPPPAEASEHFANLAVEILDAGTLSDIADELLDGIEQDREARVKRQEQYEAGLKMSGLSDEDASGADFDGSSIVHHPVITESCIDFAARAMKEIFPPSGPVKTHILGTVTTQRLEKADRKKRRMNRQLMVEMKEFRAELEQTLSQVPMGGSQYLKMYYSRRKKRPTSEFVPVDNVLIPFAATDWESAERKTHIQYVTELEFKRRVKSGEYLDVELTAPDMLDRSDVEKANDKIEGRQEDPFNIDGLRTIFEVCCYLDIEEADDFLPYVVTIDKSTRKILAVYRNWDEEDASREELTHMVEFRFIPWRGAYGLGFPHIIGGLTTAITGSLRALLDSAMINNIPTAIRLAGKANGQTIQLRPGKIAEIEGPVGNGDIRQQVMPIPFNPPSPVLFQLLGFLTDAAKGVVRTTFEDLAEQKDNMPVGTTMALIEQGMTVFSSIHARLHESMYKALQILHRLNKYHLTEETQKDEAGEVLAKRSDFEGPMDVVPVSDPNIFSETQRMAQMQAIAQRAQVTAPLGIYDLRKVEERILDQLKIPNKEELLAKVPEPQNMNAVNENVAATLGRPITAFPDQDHMAHLLTHIDFLKNPVFANPFIGKSSLPILLNHLREHIALLYVQMVNDATSEAAGTKVTSLIDTKSPEVMQEFDRLMAAASPEATKTVAMVLQEVMPVVDQLAQQVAQMQAQQMPTDPKAQAQAAETQRKAQADQAKAQGDAESRQLKAQEVQQNAEKAAREHQLAQAKLASEQQQKAADRASEEKQTAADLTVRKTMNDSDNETAMTLATMEIEDARMAREQAAEIAAEDRAAGMHDKQLDREFKGEKIGVSTGTGINP